MAFWVLTRRRNESHDEYQPLMQCGQGRREYRVEARPEHIEFPIWARRCAVSEDRVVEVHGASLPALG